MERSARHPHKDHSTATAEAEAPREHQASFTSHGEIPPVAHAAAAAHPSASDRAFHIPGGDRNVSMEGINQHHHGDHQATRLGFGGHEPHVIHAHTAVYDNGGAVIGHQAAGGVAVNAGQICHLKLPEHPHAVACVFAHGEHPGWIPISAFTHPKRLHDEQAKESGEINHERHAHADLKHEGTPHAIRHRTIPTAIDQLFTKPNQQSQGANHAHDYFLRGKHLNILLNLPTWHENGHNEGERFGSASDIVTPIAEGAPPTQAATFHKLHGPAHVPLYKHGEHHEVDQLAFAYGYIVNSGGEKRLGWINAFFLDPI